MATCRLLKVGWFLSSWGTLVGEDCVGSSRLRWGCWCCQCGLGVPDGEDKSPPLKHWWNIHGSFVQHPFWNLQTSLLRRLRYKMSSYMLLTSASQVLREVGRHFAANFPSIIFDWHPSGETWREFPYRRGHPVPFRGTIHSFTARCFDHVFCCLKRRELGDNRPFWYVLVDF